MVKFGAPPGRRCALLAGNLLAALFRAFLCAPIAVRTRLNL